ncbi:MAG: hypothetical protein ABI414_14000 [Devosia sp.]
MSMIQTALRTAAIVAVLGLGAVAPSASAQTLNFGFGHGFDDDDDDFFGPPQLAICLTDSQIRRSIANRGYSQISLNVPNHKRVQVRATKGGVVYLLKFNFCTNQIEERTALRRAQ